MTVSSDQPLSSSSTSTVPSTWSHRHDIVDDRTDSSTVALELPPSSTVSSKVSATILGDGSFEAKLKERSKQKKDKEDLSIAELRVCMADMERSLALETQRRSDTTSSLQQLCSDKVSSMEQRLNEMIDNRISSILDRIQRLESKVTELNVRLEEERTRIPADIERMGQEIQTALRSLQEDFVLERKDRLQRESRLIKQVSDHADYVHNRWNQERNEREISIQQVLKLVQEEHAQFPTQNDNSSDIIVSSHSTSSLKDSYLDLQNLWSEVERERQERKAEDEEIIQALYRYTEKLEKSLSIMSGEDE